MEEDAADAALVSFEHLHRDEDVAVSETCRIVRERHVDDRVPTREVFELCRDRRGERRRSDQQAAEGQREESSFWATTGSSAPGTSNLEHRVLPPG
jgi:hypothetical protein